MTTTPELTVAIPTYNGAKYLGDALTSILEQRVSGVNFDLLICDDQSTDRTLELIRNSVGDLARVIINPERLGLARNWNRCVELSGTPLVAIFHQDDVMRPGHLATHLAAFTDQGVGMVASAASVIDERGDEVPETLVGRGGLGLTSRVFDAGDALPLMIEANPIRCSGVTLRREAHLQLGGFDPSYQYVVDWEFWIRLAANWRLAWLASPTVAIRWHGASETHRFKTSTRDLEETTRLLNTLSNLRLANYAEFRQRADRRLARAYINRAYDAASHGDAGLARICMKQAWQLSPRSWSILAKDPKFTALMAFSFAFPSWIQANRYANESRQT